MGILLLLVLLGLGGSTGSSESPCGSTGRGKGRDGKKRKTNRGGYETKGFGLWKENKASVLAHCSHPSIWRRELLSSTKGWEGAAAAAAAPAEVAPAGQGWASPRHGPKLSGESCGAAGPRMAPFLMHHHASVLQLPQLLTPGGQWGNFWRWGGGKAGVNWLLFYTLILLH